MKRAYTLLAVLSLVVVCMVLLPSKAHAATEDYYTYTVSNGEATITDCDTSISGDIVIPDTLGGYPVTSIGQSAFAGCTNLTRIAIPDSVTSIGISAFRGCTGLITVTIPDSVTSIDNYAFSGCSSLSGIWVNESNYNYSSDERGVLFNKDKTTLIVAPGAISGSYTIPDSVTSIGWYAFDSCTGLTSVTIGGSVTSIGWLAFQDCTGLTVITIPNSVTSIGGGAFQHCTNLATVVYCGTQEQWDAISSNSSNNPLTNAELQLHRYENGVCSICGESVDWEYTITDGKVTIDGYTGSETDLIIPAMIENLPVTSIGDWAFYGCTELISVTIPDSIISIGGSTFYECSGLTNISIGNGVAKVGFSAFYGCTSLQFITYDNAKYLGNSSNPYVYLCEATSTEITACTIHKNTKVIGVGAFQHCSSLTSINIPSGVRSIGTYAFNFCTGLTNITIPASVTSIDNYAFAYCDNLQYVVYCGTQEQWNAISIGDYDYRLAYVELQLHDYKNGVCTFCGFSVWNYTIADGEVTITGYTGGETDLIIPAMIENLPVTSIGSYAFINCSDLVDVSLGNGITSIGEGAFYNCTSLTSITIPDSATSIGRYAFIYCSDLVDVSLGNGITSIGDCAFKECTSLTSITIPDSATSIGDHAFSLCSTLTSITIPDSVTSIGSYAFCQCYNLVDVSLGNGITSIGDSAFDGCTSLSGIWVNKNNYNYSSDERGVLFDKDKTTLIMAPGAISDGYTVPNSVTSIGEGAFYNCTSLTSVTIADSVTSIGEGAFEWCTSLTSVTIGDSVTSIGDYAFSWCAGLTSITIPDSVTSIGSYAFFNCSDLVDVSLGNGITSIGDGAFCSCPSLTTVVYCGTQEQWDAVRLGLGNSPLSDATLEFHNYKNGVCSLCGHSPVADATLNVYLANVRLQELMKMGFYFTMDTDETVLEIGAIVWTAEEYANETAFNFGFTKGTKYLATVHTNKDGSNYYSIETNGIPAQEIDTLLYIIPYVKTENGYAYGIAKSNSILNVCKYQYKNDTDEVKEIIADVLNYATAARNYFVAKGELDAPAETFNSILSESDKVLAWSDNLYASRASVDELTSAYTPTAYQIYVYIQEALKIEFVFADTSVTGMMYWKGADYTKQDVHDGATKTGETAISVHGKYVVGVVDGINAFNIYEDYYVRGYNANGEMSKTYTTSIAAYLTYMIQTNSNPADAETEALVELCKAMLIYGKNATENNSVNKA